MLKLCRERLPAGVDGWFPPPVAGKLGSVHSLIQLQCVNPSGITISKFPGRGVFKRDFHVADSTGGGGGGPQPPPPGRSHMGGNRGGPGKQRNLMGKQPLQPKEDPVNLLVRSTIF